MKYVPLLLFVASVMACTPEKPAQVAFPSAQNYIQADKDATALAYHQSVYVPVYSEIYLDHNRRILLTATLSIRNTSTTETLYIDKVEYHGSSGQLLRQYLTNPIQVKAMAAATFVVEQNEKEGGPGASFVVHWGADTTLSPVIQAVMIGAQGQQGISFVTEGHLQ